ncbi:unnamed protein product [Heterobilharzia americana]|nr:unnamed protein product [Heterobilharzia americana]
MSVVYKGEKGNNFNCANILLHYMFQYIMKYKYVFLITSGIYSVTISPQDEPSEGENTENQESKPSGIKKLFTVLTKMFRSACLISQIMSWFTS